MAGGIVRAGRRVIAGIGWEEGELMKLLGDGVGRESEGTPRKKPYEINSIAKRKKIAPEQLRPYWDKIESFWRVKQGSKNLQAYTLQITELEKILEHLNGLVGEEFKPQRLADHLLLGACQQIGNHELARDRDQAQQRAGADARQR